MGNRSDAAVANELPHQGGKCPTCGGPVKTENFNEATTTSGKCGYFRGVHRVSKGRGGTRVPPMWTGPCKLAVITSRWESARVGNPPRVVLPRTSDRAATPHNPETRRSA